MVTVKITVFYNAKSLNTRHNQTTMLSLNSLPFCVAILDKEGFIVKANKRFEYVVSPLSKVSSWISETSTDSIPQLQGAEFATALISSIHKPGFNDKLKDARSGPFTDEAEDVRLNVETLVLIHGMPIYRVFDWTFGPSENEGCVTIYGTMITQVDAVSKAREAEFMDFFENAPIALHW